MSVLAEREESALLVNVFRWKHASEIKRVDFPVFAAMDFKVEGHRRFDRWRNEMTLQIQTGSNLLDESFHFLVLVHHFLSCVRRANYAQISTHTQKKKTLRKRKRTNERIAIDWKHRHAEQAIAKEIEQRSKREMDSLSAAVDQTKQTLELVPSDCGAISESREQDNLETF